MDVAQSLRHAREARGLSIQDVADRVRLPIDTITAWESGRAVPSDIQFEILSLLYGAAVEDLKEGRVREAAPMTARERLLRRAKSISSEKVADVVLQGSAVVRDVIKKRRAATKLADQPVRTIEYEVRAADEGKKAQTEARLDEDIEDDEDDDESKSAEKRGGLTVPYSPILITTVFLLLGFLLNAWHPAWMLFLTIPLVFDDSDDLLTRLTHPVCLTLIYLIMGFYLNLWHPGWLIFMAVPIFGTRRQKSKKKNKSKNKKDK